MFSQSIIKNETLRRKTKKIRDTGRRMTAIYSDYFNVNSSPIVSKFRKSSIFHRSTLSPKIVPSSKNTDTELLPTKFIIDVLKCHSGKDLLNLRLVSKRFNEIIQNHALELPKIKTDALNLCHPKTGDKQKIQPIRNCCKSLILENMDKPLRHLKTQRLTLTEITVTSKLIRFLHRSIKYQLKELRFVECRFLIKSNELAILIKQWEPKFLHFNNCKWILNGKTPIIYEEEEYQQKFLNDLFFSMNKTFDFLCVDFSASPQQRLGFTDKFSNIFTNSSTLPSTIIFNNCLINITAKTLEIAIESYINLSKQPNSKLLPQQYLWSFGTITDTYGNILSTLSNFEEFVVSQNKNLNCFECIFQVSIESPLLFLSIKFPSLNFWEKKSFEKKNDCEILWEKNNNAFDFPQGFL